MSSTETYISISEKFTEQENEAKSSIFSTGQKWKTQSCHEIIRSTVFAKSEQQFLGRALFLLPDSFPTIPILIVHD